MPVKAKRGYATKRIAPQGYQAVTRQLARCMYDTGYDVTLCGNNVNAYHVFQGWGLGCTVNYALYNHYDFGSVVNNFMFYLEKELGSYPVFYVKTQDLQAYQEYINNTASGA
jgi:hypothetical protein